MAPPGPTDATARRVTPSCRLETFPVEIIAMLLTTIHLEGSAADLVSFLLASPIFHQCFLSCKRSIIMAPAVHTLGPVLVDVLTFLRVAETGFPDLGFQEAAYVLALDELALRYRTETLLVVKDSSALNAWIRDMSDATAIRVARLNRALSYFANLYRETRFTALDNAIDGAPCQNREFLEPSLTLSEHRRLAQAFLRSEILELIHCSRDRYNPDYERPIDIISSFLAPWEMEQATQARYFLSRVFPHLEVNCDFRQWRKLGNRFSDMLGFWCRIHSAARQYFAADHKERSERARGINDLFRGPFNWPGYPDVGGYGTWDEFDKPKTGKQWTGSSAKSLLEPPYAWLDALSGQSWGWTHWGNNLHPQHFAHPAVGALVHSTRLATTWRIFRWRFFGFMFWDRDRIKLLKMHVSEYDSGWILD